MASIKLKHASGNSTILNSPAANPTNDVTLKLPSTTGSAGQVLQVASANHSATNAELEFATAATAGGLTMLDTYFLTSNLSLTAQGWTYLKTNFTRANGTVGTMNVTAIGGALGTDTSGSATIFSFPSTGYYELIFSSSSFVSTTSSAHYVYNSIYITRDNSSYDNQINGIANIFGNANSIYGFSQAQAIIDVTNITNDKFKLAILPETGAYAVGSSDKFYTWLQVKKLADT